MDKKEYIDKIITSYTESKIDNSAKNKFHEWLIDEDCCDDKETALLDIWNKTTDQATGNTIESFNTLSANLQRTTETKYKRYSILRYVVTAACIAVAVAVTYFIMEEQTTDPSFNESYSGIAAKDTILLPDGSTVYTNSKTLVVYPQSFGTENRILYLSGEAYFKVERNDDLPFIVKAGEFTVTALGTEFDVASYAEDMYFKATLITGSISVEHTTKDTNIILSANKQFVYDKLLREESVKIVDINEVTAWQRGELIFRNVTMREVLDVIERNYDVALQYNTDTFDDDRYNLRFKKNIPINEIMAILKIVSGSFDYTMAGNSYYITSKEKNK